MILKALILLALILSLVSPQQYLGADDTITLNCTSQNKAFNFKTMQTFSILSFTKQDGVTLTSNKTSCTLEKLRNHICTFENMTRQVNVSCPGVAFETPKLVKLVIQRADTLAHGQTSHEQSNLVHVELNHGEQGIVSVLLTDNIATRLSKLQLSTINNGSLNLFLVSECVDDIIIFGDRLKIAVKKKTHACVIGLNGEISEWRFFKTVTEFSLNESIYSGYLEKTVPKTYTLNDRKINLYIVVESEQIEQLRGLAIQAQFVSINGNKTFNITNFQPGLPIFDIYIYLDHSYATLTLKSNYNIMYTLYEFSSTDNQAMITEDSYLYTEVNEKKDNSFVIELAGFHEQQDQKRVILFTTSNNQTFDFKFEQCFTSTCHNTTLESQVITTGQFTPVCNHLIEEMCYVKIILTHPINEIVGILPLTYSQSVELKLNVIHQGILKRENILHFIVKKETLVNVASEVLTVGLSGAKVYLTYNPQCKKIYCAEYWAVGNTLQIPKEKKDLFIFIEGSMHSHYTLLIDSQNGNGVHLPESVAINQVLSQKEKRRYYLYTPTDPNKSFEINCNALPNTLVLLVNIRSKTFPSKETAAFTSKDCYIHIKPSQFSAGDVAYITVERVRDSQSSVIYGVMGMTQGNAIMGHWRQPFHDFFQPNSSKTFKYLLFLPLHDILLKIDLYEQIQMVPIVVEFGDSKNLKYTIPINDTKTLAINTEMQQKFCSTQPAKQCYLYVQIFNPGDVGLEISVTLWAKMEPIKLVLGEYQNFQTGALGQQTHFYLPIDNPSKPINIYIFSNQVEIEVIGQLWNPRESVGAAMWWPFPTFEHLANETLNHLVYSLSASLYFGKQILKTATNNSIVLITVRDRTHAENNSQQSTANSGNIQLVASNGFTTLREDDKFQYTINNDQAYHFQFPLGNLITLQKQEIYFYNLALSGTSHIAYYFSSQNLDESLKFASEEMVIVQLDDFKETLKNENRTDHSITFVVKCVGGVSCKFLASVVSSSSQYRQLTLGVPEQFYIPPHETAIFQFNDYYNEDFKIKVQREEGFPEYKLISCPGIKKIDCLTPLLKKKTVIDQSSLILTGRSHELKIDTTSPHYCKGCAYYIVFYSFSQPIYGSLTITRSGQAVILKESVPLTTELYSDNEDSYLISTIPDSERFVTIVPHMGKINIELVEVLQSSEKKPRIHNQNSSGKASIYLQLQKTTVSVLYNLKLRSLDNENVMYTIVLSSKKNFVSLEDGVPFKTTLQPNSNFKVEYDPAWKSTILVTATSPIEIKLICEDKNATENHNHKIKYSEVLNVSLIHVDVNECSNYIIEITNKKLTNITILPNDEQILLLPFQMAIPSLVTKNKCQMYQVPIQQKTLLKIVMYICQPGNAFLGISHDKNHMLHKKYDRKFTIEGDRFTEVFEYAASPGILYFEVHSESDSIQYAIEVFPFYKDSEESKTKISLSDAYIETVPISSDKFKLKFQPYKIVDPGVNYTVSYVIVESIQRHYLRKSLRCSMTFFDLKNPSTTFKESYLKVEQEANGSLSAMYEPSYPHSYITIIPVIEPRPQSYTTKPSYDISELSIGKGPKFFQKGISILMGVIEELSGIEDENTLNFILIFIIVVTNICIISLFCVIGARHCRNTIIVERSRLATTEREGRFGGSNSLDMLQSKQDIEVNLPAPSPQAPALP